MKSINVSAADCVREHTLTVEVNVVGVRLAAARIWLGVWLFRLAAYVMGCGIEVNK